MSGEKTYQVSSGHFVAGVLVRHNRIVHTAPILHWLKGKSLAELAVIATSQRWKIIGITKKNK